MRKLFSRAIGVVVAAAMLGSSFSGSVNALDTETSGYGSTEMTAAEEEPVYPENPQSGRPAAAERRGVFMPG